MIGTASFIATAIGDAAMVGRSPPYNTGDQPYTGNWRHCFSKPLGNEFARITDHR